MSLATEKGNKLFKNISELLDSYQNKSVVILGEPGAGKSFMINRYIDNNINLNRIFPPKQLYVLLKLMDIEQSDIVKNITTSLSVSKTVTEEDVKNLLRKGNITLFFDGYNEIFGPADFANRFERNFKQFINSYPKCQVITTCRYGEFPSYLRNSFEVMAEAMSLNRDEIEKYLTEILGEHHSKMIDTKTKDLCRNPLMLSMVLYSIHSKGNKIKNLPKNKADLYNEYFEIIYKHQEISIPGRFKITKKIYEDILGNFAFSLNNEKLSIPLPEFNDWLNANYPTEFQYRDELLKLVPLKRTGGDESTVSFIHQSFQEYFTAKYFSVKISSNGSTIQNLDKYYSNIRWQETILLLAQMMQDATHLIKDIVKDRKSVKAEKWYLATKCLSLSKHSRSKREIANDLLVFSLDNFKYGEAFRYELLFALKEIISICDKTKYKRLIENAEFWFEKYAHHENEPNDLKHLSYEELIEIINTSVMEDLLIDALHTIVKHKLAYDSKKKKNLLLILDKKVQNNKISDRLKEQIIISYANLREKTSIPYLSKIISNPKEGKFHKALALNALGAIGDEEAVPLLIEYIKNDLAEYRDSAAWALTEIKPKNIVDDLMNVLKNSITKKIDQYTIGAILYALGVIKNSTVVPSLLDWYEKMKNCIIYNEGEKSYIFEDFIYALGMLKSTLSISVLIELLKLPDSIIKVRVADSLANIGDKIALPLLEKLSKTESNKFALESISKAIETLKQIY